MRQHFSFWFISTVIEKSRYFWQKKLNCFKPIVLFACSIFLLYDWVFSLRTVCICWEKNWFDFILWFSTIVLTLNLNVGCFCQEKFTHRSFITYRLKVFCLVGIINPVSLIRGFSKKSFFQMYWINSVWTHTSSTQTSVGYTPAHTD